MLFLKIFYSVLVLYISRWEVRGSNLVSQLRNEVNLDLPVDEEYEDLRAELLAYHTAFASLAAARSTDAIGSEEPDGRRSMKSTTCWRLGGICIKRDLCTNGHRYLTQVDGCRDKLHVCCFSWNQYQLKDMTDFGIKNWALPWSVHQDFDGEGYLPQNETNGKDYNSDNESKRYGENNLNSKEKQTNKHEDDKESEASKNHS